MSMRFEFRWRSFCWFERVQYRYSYGGSIWLHYYRIYKFEYTRDRDAEMSSLSA